MSEFVLETPARRILVEGGRTASSLDVEVVRALRGPWLEKIESNKVLAGS